ncbi:hypothetical protein RU639_009765 [Aspergillus parasiticus]
MSKDTTSESLTQNDYLVGWICALPLEAAAATALLDEEHPPLDQDPGDMNAYTLGRIGRHNIVIGCLPLGTIGESPATAVAKDMLRSFPNIKIGFMVGIGGGAPGPASEKPEDDIRLGDIVVSKPGPGHGGVIQYDYGKTLSEGEFIDIGYLNRPPNVILTALTKLISRNELEGSSVPRQVTDMGKKYPRKCQEWKYQGVENDQLFVESFRHPDIDRSCKDIHCAESEDRLVSRKPRCSTAPVVHCGLIASGNQVMRDAVAREKLRKKHDSHKDKRWQPYAAAVSAAFTKELLQLIPVVQLERAHRVSFMIGKMEKELTKLNDHIKPLLQTQEREERRRVLNWLAPSYYESQQADAQRNLDHDSFKTFFENGKFKAWSEGSKDVETLFCPGLPGSGKTTLASIVINKLRKAQEKQNSVVAFLYFNYNLQAEQTLIHVLRTILRQLIDTLPSIPSEVTELYCANQFPSLRETFMILSGVLQNYDKMYVVFDALDECLPEYLAGFVEAVKNLQRMGARLMLTSRYTNIIEREFRDMKKCSFLDIRAVNEDMETYITRNFDFSAFYKIPDELPQIARFKQVVIASARGMFILVRLFVNILKNKCTKGEIQEELENIEHGRTRDPIHEAYKKTSFMIERSDHSEWAYRIISWVFYARRPLSVNELTEVLAAQTQRDNNCLDMNYAPPDIHIIISYCSGLIVASSNTEKIEFVHLTAYQYFEENHHDHPWIAKSLKEISLACLRYLSFGQFSAREKHTSFLDYAVHFWAEHTGPVQADWEVRQTAKRFLKNPTLTSSADQMFPANEHTYISLSLLMDGSQESGATGLHLVARFGLVTQLRDLLEEIPVSEINSRDPYGQTPLVLAVRHGHWDIINIILDNSNVDPNLTDDDGRSPLSIASQLGYASVVEKLLSTGETDLNLPASDGWSPLMYASRGNHTEVIKLLLADKKTHTNFTSPDGQTALKLAVEMGFTDVVRLLLESGRVEINPSDLTSRDPFMIALENGNTDVIRLLLENGYSNAIETMMLPSPAGPLPTLGLGHRPSGLLTYNESPETRRIFWMAVEKGLVDVVLLLLRTGKANPNLTDSSNKSALMLAVENKHKEVVEALLCVGSACTDAKAKNGDTALFLAVVRRDMDITRILLEIGMANPDLGCDSPFKYPLPYAVENNYQDIVQILLNTGKADPNLGLQAAISNKQIAMVHSFLDIAGVDPNTQDRVNGQTALMTAIREQDLQLVQALLENKMVDVNAQNWEGETALMRAVTMYDLEVVKLLVEEYGADLSIRSRYGATALDWAEKYRWTVDEVMRLLSPKKARNV